MPELEKRTHVYVLRPREYEISGCPCGNDDPEWSEYLHHLWCAKCEKDFLPAQDGVFGGPIPINGAHLMGLCFAQLNLKTCEIEVQEFAKAESGCGYCANAKVIKREALA